MVEIHLVGIVTHLIAMLVGGLLGSYITLAITKDKKNKELTIKMLIIDFIHFVIIGIFLGSIINSLFLSGEPPSFIFSGFAAFSFTSLIGDSGRFIEILGLIKR